MTARMRDVAERAGVSIKTVSNVVNGYPHVTTETRERVQRALDELGYAPNISARHLRGGRSGMIALALPELDMPYFAELARCVIREAEQRSWLVLLEQTDGLADRERIVVSGPRPRLIDGLILSPLTSTAAQLRARRSDAPLVLLGEKLFDVGLDHVSIDNVAAARMATEHLISLGRQRIAAIGDQRDRQSGTARLRLRGYREALRAAGVTVDRRLVRHAPTYKRVDGATAMAQLLALDDPPDAVFCFTDLLALGALRILYEAGVRVPEDVAVVGFDDIEESRFSVPSLTTVAPDKPGLARAAVDLLAARIADDAGASQEVRIPFRLLVRESTTGRAGAAGTAISSVS